MPERDTGDWRDELLQPTLQDASVPPRVDPRSRPWRLASQFYVAFFGGPIAATIVAFENARRLRMPERTCRWIAWIGALATLLLVVAAAVWIAEVRVPVGDVRREMRLIPRAAALALFGVFYSMQRMPDRLYAHREAARGAEPYGSLWRFGIASVVIGSVGIALLLFAAVFAFVDGPLIP